jgi:phosphoesterase RecJ-like protein
MQQLLQKIREAEHILVVSHLHPDGDNVGSVLSLKYGLTSLQKEVDVLLVDGIPPAFQFLLPEKTPVLSQPAVSSTYDLVIVVDTPDFARTGIESFLHIIATENKLTLIDHHPKGDLAKAANQLIHNTSAASTTELVHDLLMELGVKISPSIATCLLTGLYTDTGGFQYENTTQATLERAAEFMRRGGKLQVIIHHINQNKSLASLKLLGIALDRVRLVYDKKCAVSVLDNACIERCKANQDDLTGIVNQFNALDGPAFSLLLTEYEQGIVRGTLRSSDQHIFDVHRLAKILGGDGHPRAAGFTVQGSLRERNRQWRIEVS